MKNASPDSLGNTVLHTIVDSNMESRRKCRKERIDSIRMLVSEGADVNKRNKFGSTPVHLAAKHCHIEVLKIFKNNKALLDEKTMAGETPLIFACKYMSELLIGTSAEMKLIDFFTNSECDINATDEEGYSALHYTVERCSTRAATKLVKAGANVHLRSKRDKLTPLHLAAKRKDPTYVDILINAGASVKSEKVDVILPLHLASLGSTLKVVKRLISYGSDINYPERSLHLTPLHLAVYKQRHDLFQLLIRKGADANRSSKDGLTPLHLSSMLGNLDFTKTLIDHGADVNFCDGNGSTPLHLAIRKYHDVVGEVDGDGETSLIVSLLTCQPTSISRDYEAIVRLLIDNGSDVNAVTKCGRNSLHLAAESSVNNSAMNSEKHGASVDRVKSNSENMPLHLSSQQNNKTSIKMLIKDGTHAPESIDNLVDLDSEFLRVFKLLISCGANVDCKIFHSQLTPLHSALMKKNIPAAKILIEAGADVNALTLDGHSPMYSALEQNCSEVLKPLIERGAKLSCNGKRCLYTLLYILVRNNDDEVIGRLNDLENVPLLQAICSIEDEDMKKALLLLPALVDMYNEDGCMSVNCDVRNDRVDNSGCLRMFRINVTESEVYSTFACDEVLSGASQALGQNISKTKPEYVLDYLCMLSAVDLSLTRVKQTRRTSSTEDFYSHWKHKTHYEKCLDEVDKLKCCSIANGVTLYELLHMRSKRRRSHLRNLDFEAIEMEFPIYHKLLLARYREDVIKGVLMETAQLAFLQLTGVELPILCIEDIFMDMGVMNMLATIEAAEIID